MDEKSICKETQYFPMLLNIYSSVRRSIKGLLQKCHFWYFLKKNNIVISSKDSLYTLESKKSSDNNIFNKIVLRKDDSDIAVFRQVFLNKEYKILLDLIIEKKIKVNFMIDCGANIGLTSVYFNHYLHELKFICIEPDSNNFDLLKKNLRYNLKSVNYNLEKFGLWSNSNFLRVTNSFRDGKSWSINVESSKLKTNLRGITLYDIMKKYNLEQIDLLKIDIEGAEKEIFTNDKKINSILKRTKIICIEIHEEVVSKDLIYKILEKNAFEIFNRHEFTIGVNSFLVNPSE